ncbi:hypothetical protein MNBD_BACTEROID03-1767 [hydrothermal vent metagenome]|uniref:Uncharacterized protein n=1 Tax=hydrothermal vent metagenome TaxID=652676 RepID=A0A3B0TB13_9ZZZZ
MKNSLFFILIATCVSCSFNEPIDYYNAAVGAGNSSHCFMEFESHIERLDEGIQVDSINLAERAMMYVPSNEKVVQDLKDLLGNKESDSMLKAAINLLSSDIACTQNPTTQKLFTAVGNSLTIEELVNNIEPYNTYLDSIYGVKDRLYEIYDKETTWFARKNDIEIKLFGRDIIPGVNDIKK